MGILRTMDILNRFSVLGEMTPEKGFFLFLLAISVAIIRAAPQQKVIQELPNTENAISPRQEPEVQSPPAASVEGSADKPASSSDSKPASPTDSKPVSPTDSKPGDPSAQKPVTPTQSPKPPKDDEETMADEALNNCWTCLLEAAEDLCSYFLSWTVPSKISGVNLFSLFQGRSSEESDETTEKPANSPLLAFSNLFRYRRSSGRSRRSVPVQYSFGGVPVEQEEFLDLINSFYMEMRDRFSEEHPGAVSRSTLGMYKRPDEIADIAAYVLGVPRDRLVQVYERLKSKEIGDILLKALRNRMDVLNGEQRTSDIKTFSNLTPTSISYFFQELFASVNGIATGITEMLGIALENGTPPVQPN